MFGTSSRRLALLTVPLALAGVLGATAPAEAHKPTSLTCQGKGIDRAAKVHYRTETFIKAPLRTVWNLQTDVEAWPSWQNPVLPVTMKRLDDGPFRKHSRFQWTIPVPPGVPYPPGDVTSFPPSGSPSPASASAGPAPRSTWTCPLPPRCSDRASKSG